MQRGGCRLPEAVVDVGMPLELHFVDIASDACSSFTKKMPVL